MVKACSIRKVYIYTELALDIENVIKSILQVF